MNRSGRAGKQSGYSLIELMIYCALMSGIIAGCMSVFLSANRLFAITALAQERLVDLRETRADFVSMVHRASGTRAAFGSHTAGPETLILALPDAAGEMRTVVCTTRNAEKKLTAYEYTGDSVSGFRRFAGRYDDVSFETIRTPGSIAPTINLRLRMRPENGERNKNTVLHQFTASPRGGGRP